MEKTLKEGEYYYVYDIHSGDCIYTAYLKDGKLYFCKYEEPDEPIFYM